MDNKKLEEFYELRKRIITSNPIPTPTPAQLESRIKQLETLLKWQGNRRADELMKMHNDEQCLAYGDSDFLVLPPVSVSELIKETLERPNYDLMNFLEAFLMGILKISFLREASSITKPYVFFVVRTFERCIEGVYDREGGLPKIAVLEFLKKYSNWAGLKYDPASIVFSALEDVDYTLYSESELSDYIKFAKTNSGY